MSRFTFAILFFTAPLFSNQLPPSQLNDDQYEEIFSTFEQNPYMKLSSEKALAEMLTKYEGAAKNLTVRADEPKELIVKKVRALLILAFISFRMGKINEAQDLFERALSTPVEENPSLARLYDEAGRFYEATGDLNRCIALHLKAGKMRKGAIADFYVGLALKSAGSFKLALDWFALAQRRLNDGFARGKFAQNEVRLHLLVALGNMGETNVLDNAFEEADRNFRNGEALADEYIQTLSAENKIGQLDQGVLNFFRRYADYLKRRDLQERLAVLIAKVNSITVKVGKNPEAIFKNKPASAPLLQINIWPTLPSVGDAKFSEDASYSVFSY